MPLIFPILQPALTIARLVLGFLSLRAIRSDEAQQQFQQRNRQRQIVQLIEAELKTWLFSQRPRLEIVQEGTFSVFADAPATPGHAQSA